MISVLIVGDGNVATHLYNAFTKIGDVRVSKINSRRLENIPPADITILAISDDAIAEVSKNIQNNFVVHTSGACSINELKNKKQLNWYMVSAISCI